MKRVDREPLFDAHEVEGSVDPDLLFELTTSMIDPDSIDPDDVYRGRNVRWVGLSGRMYRARWDQVHAHPDNIFYPDKVATFVELFDDNPGLLVIAPRALVSSVDWRSVAESQRDARRGHLFSGMGMTRPFTTGDEELDEWLIDPAQYIKDNARDQVEREELEDDLDRRLAKASQKHTGDLGKFVFDLRDGNHRAFAAQLAGEPYVWVLVQSKYMQGDLPDGELE